MDFEFTEELKATQNTIRKFISRECTREAARELDNKGDFPEILLKKIADMGICGLTVAEEYNGVGSDILAAVVVAEELSAINPALAGAFIGSAFCGGKNISVLGNEDQKKKYLPGIAEGSLLFTYGITEPDFDYSSIPFIKTEALIDGDTFVLNGTKNFVRLADHADYILTLVCTDNTEEVQKGLSFIIIDMKSPGISINKIGTVGFNSLGLYELIFKNVSVPTGNVLGGFNELNRGLDQYMKIMESEHLEIAACSLGIAQGAYEYAKNYAKERVQFGKPIVKFQAIQNMLVEMATSIRASRLLTYQAGWLADHGESCILEATMARTYAAEAARKICLQCMQILGGYGYAMEYDVQRYFRDAMVILGGGKTAEVLKNSMGPLLDLS